MMFTYTASIYHDAKMLIRASIPPNNSQRELTSPFSCAILFLCFLNGFSNVEYVRLEIFGGASLKAPFSFFLRILSSSLVSLGKKGKESNRKNREMKCRIPETPMHGDDPACIYRVSFPSVALLSFGFSRL